MKYFLFKLLYAESSAAAMVPPRSHGTCLPLVPQGYTCVTQTDPIAPSAALMTEAGLHVLSQVCDKAYYISRCGTWGCILRDRHKGLHEFALTGKRKRTCVFANNNTGVAENADNTVEATEAMASEALKQLKRMRQSPNSGEHPLQQVIIGSVIVPATIIPSLRFQRWWSAKETGSRAGYYEGTITQISKDYKWVFVLYDDDDYKHWEEVGKIEFL